MNKNDFQIDTRYTITWRDADGRWRPLGMYVYRTHETFMVVRFTGGDGLLHKIAYADVMKIVASEPVQPRDRTAVPKGLLEEKVWKDRNVMHHFAGSPQRGK